MMMVVVVVALVVLAAIFGTNNVIKNLPQTHKHISGMRAS
jgi:hypothetical protein